jgi:hypothetical protein
MQLFEEIKKNSRLKALMALANGKSIFTVERWIKNQNITMLQLDHNIVIIAEQLSISVDEVRNLLLKENGAEKAKSPA